MYMGVPDVSKLFIEGGKPLEGEIPVQGAKNAILPILAATLLNGDENIIHHCPRLRDVEKTVEVLRALGCYVRWEDDTLTVDSSGMCCCRIDEELMRQMRSSIIFLGAILSRWGEAVVSMPGGCEIGTRPIDLHLKAMQQLGVRIREAHGYIYCNAHVPCGTTIHLDFPSVGATENVMLAAVRAKGITVITNAAREPEIVDLQNFLNKMGAKIVGAGGSVIRIDGVAKLSGVEYSCMPDRIVAATYLACGAVTNSMLTVDGVCPNHMSAMLSVLREMDVPLLVEPNRVTVLPYQKLKKIDTLRTMPYPGFPTDIQSPFMALAATAEGTSVFIETIFENRYQHVEELNRMGADIKVDGRTAVVRGVPKLSGANVVARELRGGAALVVAALAAEGETCIDRVEYIDRGYEQIESYLSACGASIKRLGDQKE